MGVLARNGDHQQDVWVGNSREKQGLAGWQQQWARGKGQQWARGKGQQGPSALLLDFAFSPVGDAMTSHGQRSLGQVLCEQEGKCESRGIPLFLGWKSRARLQAHETYMIS